jgi:hypothetical protein
MRWLMRVHQVATVSTTGSYLSSGDKRVHFGPGFGKAGTECRNSLAERRGRDSQGYAQRPNPADR